MAALFEYLLITVAAVFVIVNPLTTAFVFSALLPRASDEVRRAIAWRAVVIATGIFFAFATLGGVIFQLFGITLAAFRIAGGAILFGIAMSMIRRRDGSAQEEAREKKGDLVDDISVVPLAIPFISGPGSIATVMILTSEAPDVYHLAVVYVAVVLTTAACYLAMVHSRYIVKRLGGTGMEIMTKIFGLILAVIAVQFLINGIGEAVSDYLLRRSLALPS